MKNIYIDTLGCPKNVNDSENLAGSLEKAGFNILDEEKSEEADIVIVNTCGFINDAKKESVETILYWADTDKILVVSGCLSQRYGKELFDEVPEAHCIVGVNQYEELPEIIKSLTERKKEEERRKGNPEESDRILRVTGYEERPCWKEPDARRLPKQHFSATLKIAEGCDNRCAYCVIPSIRGPYRSRPMEAVLDEGRRLAKSGVKELILVAQDVTAYGMDIYGEYSLHRLLEELCKTEGIRWIRLMYCYEDRITPELIDVMAREEKICKYIDMPLQHCSDNVLKAMRRRSTEKSIRNTVKTLRENIEGIRIRTTLITGFPGETEDDFRRLAEFVEETGFDRLGVFAYSREEGTEAGEMTNQVPEEVREERRNEIMELQMDISYEKNLELKGQVMEVILEDKEGDCWNGRTRCDAPEIDNSVIIKPLKDHIPGDIINVKITEAMDYDLIGEEI